MFKIYPEVFIRIINYTILICGCVLFISPQISGQQRPQNFNPRNTGSSFSQNQQAQGDTIDRPPFNYSSLLLEGDLRYPIPSLDTGLQMVHLIEPALKSAFYPGNLGSENSASMSFVNPVSFIGNNLGFPLFRQLLALTAEPHLNEVNRSFWSLYYGNGFGVENSLSGQGLGRIGSSHFETKFYRRFARNILFNFDYKNYSDDGSNLQGNDLSRLNFKLMQKSKKGKRISYIHFDRPAVNEILNPDRSTSDRNFIDLSRDQTFFSIGNSLIKIDTTSNDTSFTWNSRINYQKDSYEVNSESLLQQGLNLTLVKTPGDTLNFQNRLSGFYIKNQLILKKGSRKLKAFTEINLLRFSSGSIFRENLFEILLGLDFKKRVNNNLAYSFFGRSGIVDANGAVKLQGSLFYNYKNQANILVDISYNSLLPFRSARRFVVNNTVIQENDFSNKQGVDIGLKLKIIKTGGAVKLYYGSYKNVLFVGTNGVYNQLSNTTNFFRISAEQGFRIGPIHSRHALLFQTISSERLKVMPFQYKANVYFRMPLFKRRMHTHVGSDIYVFPNYVTPGIYPLAGDFFEVNDTQNSQNIFMVNPYFNVRVDRLFFFVKGINVFRKLYPSEANFVNNFPVYNYRVRFGIRWTLLD